MSTDIVAAIDLGSNSFHLIVARSPTAMCRWCWTDCAKWCNWPVVWTIATACPRKSQQRALDRLARFGQRLRHLAPEQLRIVGTNTCARLCNSTGF